MDVPPGTPTTRPRPRQYAVALFLLLSLTLCAAALTARILTAVGTRAVLDWDETYYASSTATAAHGLGFYPYVDGYPQIPDMGGVGYVLSFYVLAYRWLGPQLLSLRIVSCLVSVIGVAGIAELTRRVYGTAAALVALAIVPSLFVFALSNTIRPDVFAIAFVAWALVLYVRVMERRASPRWHGLVGLVFALGLEVHLHTAAATFAVGCAYLAAVVSAFRDPAGRRASMSALGAFVAGYAAGVLIFTAANILPNPRGFFRTAALARLSAADSPARIDPTVPMDVTKLGRSFVSPALIVPKEIERYRIMAAGMRWWEAGLWLFGVPAFLLRRGMPGSFPGRTLLVGAVAGGAIVLNASSALYFAAVLPFFVPALASAVTHGISGAGRIRRDNVSPISVVTMLVLAAAILPSALAQSHRALTRIATPDPLDTPPALVNVVRSAATSSCVLAGPTDLYARYFMAYPRFVGTRNVEVATGSTYYDLQHDPVAYWKTKNPDLVFGPADAPLRAYLAEANYVAIADDVWRKPSALSAGCVIAASK